MQLSIFIMYAVILTAGSVYLNALLTSVVSKHILGISTNKIGSFIISSIWIGSLLVGNLIFLFFDSISDGAISQRYDNVDYSGPIGRGGTVAIAESERNKLYAAGQFEDHLSTVALVIIGAIIICMLFLMFYLIPFLCNKTEFYIDQDVENMGWFEIGYGKRLLFSCLLIFPALVFQGFLNGGLALIGTQ